MIQIRIEKLRADSARMAGLVQQAVSDAVSALARGDVDLARRTVAFDEQIDAAEVAVEKSAIDLLSLFRPAAGEFRLALMVVKVNNELERVADCAGNVAKQVDALLAESEQAGRPYRVSPALQDLGQVAVELTRRAIRAYNFSDAGAAESVIRDDERADALYVQVLQESLGDMHHPAGRVERDLSHVMVAKNLERIGDHCTNVAEDIVYIDRGEIVRHRCAV